MENQNGESNTPIPNLPLPFSMSQPTLMSSETRIMKTKPNVVSYWCNQQKAGGLRWPNGLMKCSRQREMTQMYQWLQRTQLMANGSQWRWQLSSQNRRISLLMCRWWASSSDTLTYPSIFTFPLLPLHRQSTTTHSDCSCLHDIGTHFIGLIWWTHDLWFTCIYFYS